MSQNGTVAIIVLDASRKYVLMSKRLKEPAKDFYAVAGGKIDLGESPEQASERELKEETGIILEKNCISFKKTYDVTSYYCKSLNIQHFCFWFVCHSRFEVKEHLQKHNYSEKGEEWCWHKIDNLLIQSLNKEIKLFPETMNIVNKLCQSLSVTYVRHYET